MTRAPSSTRWRSGSAFRPTAVATIGDMENDLPMFAKSGVSFAMGNAADDIKQHATHVTDSNEHDGFARCDRDGAAARIGIRGFGRSHQADKDKSEFLKAFARQIRFCAADRQARAGVRPPSSHKAGSPSPGLPAKTVPARAILQSARRSEPDDGELFRPLHAGFSVGCFAAQRLCAVLISAICVSACGKLPVWRPARRIVLLGQQAEIVGDRDHAGQTAPARLSELARQHIGVRQP